MKVLENETGTIAEDGTPGLIVMTSDQFPEDATFLILIDGDINVVGETASILILGGTFVPGTQDVVFDNIGVASVTLASTSPAP